MGLSVTELGVSVQLCNADGSPDGSPIWGPYVALRGELRDKLLEKEPPNEEEEANLGSQHWLTLVAVADTQERLDALVAGSGAVGDSVPQTSMSSRRTLVEVHVGGVRETFPRRTVVASGPVVSLPPAPKVNVVHVKVHAPAIVMDEHHPSFPEFKGGSTLVAIG